MSEAFLAETGLYMCWTKWRAFTMARVCERLREDQGREFAESLRVLSGTAEAGGFSGWLRPSWSVALEECWTRDPATMFDCLAEYAATPRVWDHKRLVHSFTSRCTRDHGTTSLIRDESHDFLVAGGGGESAYGSCRQAASPAQMQAESV